MRLEYLAHSCFTLQDNGFRVLFDPYDATIGYPPPKVFDLDLIVVSHEHFDHNAVDQVPGRATVVRGVARRKYGPLTLAGQVGWHGEGEEADPVSLTLLEWGERRLAHFGDLGCGLEPEQVEYFTQLDLLLIPCGGGDTIDGRKAAALVERLRPKLVVPMHYRTPFLDCARLPGLETAQSFIDHCSPFAKVISDRQGSADLESYWAQLGPDETFVLNLQHQMA